MAVNVGAAADQVRAAAGAECPTDGEFEPNDGGPGGLQVYGAGQWLEAKRGAKSGQMEPATFAVDADSGMIVVQNLPNQDIDDPSQVAPLLDQIDGGIAKLMAPSRLMAPPLI
jgi:hypothetical protein